MESPRSVRHLLVWQDIIERREVRVQEREVEWNRNDIFRWSVDVRGCGMKAGEEKLRRPNSTW